MSSVNLKKFVTKTQTAKMSQEWKIENFLLINMTAGESLCSPSFTIDGNDKLKWHLEVYPNGRNTDYKDFVSLYLRTESANVNHKVKCEFSIVNKNKLKDKKSEVTHHYNGVIEGWGFPKFIEIECLKNNSETFLPDGIFTLCCDIHVGFKHNTYEIDTNDQSKYFELDETYKRQAQICENLGTLLEKEELTDIELITASNNKLRAHKAILAARSPVFLAMFTNNMVEKLQSEVKIIEFGSEVVSEMLEFIYTGNVKNIEKNAKDLLYIADKYQVKELKSLCENFLLVSLSIKNAIDLLILADRHNCEDFKTKVIQFILSHKKEIIPTPQFVDLKSKQPILIADLFCADC